MKWLTLKLASYGGQLGPLLRGLLQFHVLWAWILNPQKEDDFLKDLDAQDIVVLNLTRII